MTDVSNVSGEALLQEIFKPDEYVLEKPIPLQELQRLADKYNLELIKALGYSGRNDVYVISKNSDHITVFLDVECINAIKFLRTESNNIRFLAVILRGELNIDLKEDEMHQQTTSVQRKERNPVFAELLSTIMQQQQKDLIYSADDGWFDSLGNKLTHNEADVFLQAHHFYSYVEIDDELGRFNYIFLELSPDFKKDIKTILKDEMISDHIVFTERFANNQYTYTVGVMGADAENYGDIGRELVKLSNILGFFSSIDVNDLNDLDISLIVQGENIRKHVERYALWLNNKATLVKTQVRRSVDPEVLIVKYTIYYPGMDGIAVAGFGKLDEFYIPVELPLFEPDFDGLENVAMKVAEWLSGKSSLEVYLSSTIESVSGNPICNYTLFDKLVLGANIGKDSVVKLVATAKTSKNLLTFTDDIAMI